MPASAVDVSVVLPAYNEEDSIRHAVEETLAALDAFEDPATYEVVVAENGSTDDTQQVAERLADEHEAVRVLSVPQAGRGRALNVAFGEAEGEVLVYFDVDLATDMAHLEELVDSIRKEGADVATGSRWVEGHEAERPAKRAIPSRGFNWMARTMLGSELADHQCGFKALHRDAFDDLVADLPDDNWFWDTQLLVLAQHRGFDVREFPVRWTPKGDSKLSLGRDILGMGAKTVRLWWQMKAPAKLRRRSGLLLSTLVLVASVAALVYFMDVSRVFDALRDTDARLVVLSAGVYTASLPVRGLRFRRILETLDHRVSTGFATAAVCISQTVNLVAPARSGDAVRAFVIKRQRQIPYTSGFAGLTIERATDLAAIAGLVLLVVLAGPLMGGFALGDLGTIGQGSGYPVLREGVLGALALLALVVVAGAALLTWRLSGRQAPGLRRRASSALDRVPKGQALRSFLSDLRIASHDLTGTAAVVGLGGVIWLIDSLTAYIVLRALGAQVTASLLLAVVFLAVSLANLAKVLPLTPGGIGLYEGVFTLVVSSLTPIAWPLALAAALVDHAVKNGVTALAGVVASVSLNLSMRETVEEARRETNAASPTAGNP